jgi:SAM-dependent methyltransferase
VSVIQSRSSIYKDGTYLKSNESWHQEDSPYKYKYILKALSRNRIAFRTCADVGCGAGLVSELLALQFPESRVSGFEVSEDAARFWPCRRDLGNLDYSNSNIFDYEGTFDLIICLDVFEHIEDYFGFLRSLRAKGRTFIFAIPLDMCIAKLLTPGIRLAREDVGHLHYFNTYSALKTLEDTGYKIRDYFLYAAFASIPPKSIGQALILPLRVLSLIFGKKFASTMFGGMSLIVTAD